MLIPCTCAGSEEPSEERKSRAEQSEAAQASSRSSSQREQLCQAVDTAILKVSLYSMRELPSRASVCLHEEIFPRTLVTTRTGIFGKVM